MRLASKTLFSIKLLVAVLMIVFIINSCRNLISSNPSAADQDALKINEPIAAQRVDSAANVYNGLDNGRVVYEYYRSRDFLARWHSNNEPLASAIALQDFIKRSRNHAIDPTDVYSRKVIPNPGMGAANASVHDLTLTDTFINLIERLKGLSLHQHFADSILFAALDSCNTASDTRRVISGFAPQSEHYKSLHRALAAILDSMDSSAHRYDTASVAQQIRRIGINMDRLRSDDSLFNRRYILVNIPAFELTVYDNDTAVLQSRVIVGARKDKTPNLIGLIHSITLNPYWTVPRRIAVDELLPQVKKDREYLTRHNYEVLDARGTAIDYTSVDFSGFSRSNFPYTLRQRQGSGNSLGIIKFSFNNPYSIYLHDTNARYLFKKEQRALSHGCIRVEKAHALAQYLIGPDNAVDLDHHLSAKREKVLRLDKPVPVYIRYYTCLARGDSLVFFNDIYMKDVGVTKAAPPERPILP